MINKSFKLLGAVQDYLVRSCETCDTKETIVGASYEYRCLKCGLTLDFNRNQTSVKCPNDGSNMYRI